MRSFATRLFVVVLGVSVAGGCGGGSNTPAPNPGPGAGATAASRHQSDTQGQKDDSKSSPSSSRITNPQSTTPTDPKPDAKGDTKSDAKPDAKGDGKKDEKNESKVEIKDQIKGVVRYNGKPLDGGQIAFRSADGKTVGADVAADGTYSVANPPTGTLKVTISHVDPKAVEHFRAASAASREGGKPPEGNPGKFSKLPVKYSDPNTSGLKVEYKGGLSTSDFDIKD